MEENRMKEKLLGVLIVVILLTIAFSGCNEQKTDNNPLDGLKYVDEELGFGFNPPEGWRTYGSSNTNRIVSYHPSDTDEQISLTIIVPYMYEENETLYSLGENKKSLYYTHTEEIPNATVNYTINNLTSKNTTINGNPAYEIFCNSTVETNSYDEPWNQTYYEMRKIFLIEKNKKLFEIYYVSEVYENSGELYEYYLPLVNQSINSFTII